MLEIANLKANLEVSMHPGVPEIGQLF